MWDVATGEQKATLTEHAGIGKLLVHSPDGSTIATGAEHHNDRTVRLWDAATGKRKTTLIHTHCVLGFVYSPDGSTVKFMLIVNVKNGILSVNLITPLSWSLLCLRNATRFSLTRSNEILW